VIVGLLAPSGHLIGLICGGLLVGLLVGLTGTGGGAVLTPVLILIFGVPPVAAVGTDLAASLVMKPVGGLVHLHHRTVRLDVVGWLAAGSVPGAFVGAWLFGRPDSPLTKLVEPLIGVALIATAVVMIVGRHRAEGGGEHPALRARSTALLGLAGGLAVGATSVGSGSLMIVALTLLYPGLTNAELVGTDLVQAIPLVAAATLGHLMFGTIRFGVTGALLVGAVPGVYFGARLSVRHSGRLARGALVVVMLGSGIKLLWAL